VSMTTVKLKGYLSGFYKQFCELRCLGDKRESMERIIQNSAKGTPGGLEKNIKLSFQR
jgi:hypothetical protein